MDWSAWLTGVAMLIIAIWTFTYVGPRQKSLSSEAEACVILSVAHDENRPAILQLVVKNVGTGVADHVHFDFSHPIAGKAWSLTTDKAIQSALMDEGALVNGIPVLGPGRSRKVDRRNSVA